MASMTLEEASALCARVATAKFPHALVASEGGFATLSVTNATDRFAVRTETPWSGPDLHVECKLLAMAAKGAIALEYDSGPLPVLHVAQASGGVHGLPILEVDSPPAPPVVGDTRWGEFTASSIVGALRAVLPAMDKDIRRARLCGLCVEVRDATVRFVTSDGCRLHWCDVSPVKLDFATPTGTVTASAAEIVYRMTRAVGRETVRIGFSEGDHRVSVETGACTVTSRMAAEAFPDYRAALPDEPRMRIHMSCAEFLQACKGVRSGEIRMSRAPGGWRVSASSADLGSFEVVVRASADDPDRGPPSEIGANVALMRDAVKALGAKRMTFDVGDALEPIFVRPDDTLGVVCVVMPIRLD